MEAQPQRGRGGAGHAACDTNTGLSMAKKLNEMPARELGAPIIHGQGGDVFGDKGSPPCHYPCFPKGGTSGTVCGGGE